MNATEHFWCRKFSILLTRGRCAQLFKLYGRVRKVGLGRGQQLVTDGMHAFGKSKAIREKCTGCPIGEQHACGVAAPGVEVREPSVVTFKQKPQRRRLCTCGEPVRKGSRTCSIACASATGNIGAVEVDLTDGLPGGSL
jgi:hypothetical protein